MSRRLFNVSTHRWLASLVLLSFTIRALVPLGFMPSADRPFTLQICPVGFPSHLLPQAAAEDPRAHRHGDHHSTGLAGAQKAASPDGSSHDHDAWRAQHCVFGAVTSAAPVSQAFVVTVALDLTRLPEADSVSSIIKAPRYRVQQPRAPPALS